MRDHLSRAQRYRERADECRRLAALTAWPDLRQRYREMADNYDQLARTEFELSGLAPSDREE